MAAALAFNVFNYVMLGMGLISMGATVVIAGVDSGQNYDTVLKSIDDVKEQNKSFKETYNKLLENNLSLTQEINDNIIKCIKKHQTISAGLNIANLQYAQSLKKIQLYGIIFVSVMVLLLILKQFNIVNMKLLPSEI
jgi:hypothetical protein